jgi:hypothetical protein
MIPGSVRSVPTMLANNQSHVDAIEFPSTIGFLNQGILSPIYSVVLFSGSLLNTLRALGLRHLRAVLLFRAVFYKGPSVDGCL